jgi:hypothetical protein
MYQVVVRHTEASRPLPDIQYLRGSRKKAEQWVKEHYSPEQIVSVQIQRVVVPKYPCAVED